MSAEIVVFDRIKDLGFHYVTRRGLSVGLDDMVIPDTKYTVVRDAEKQVIAVQQHYLDGAITNGESNNKVIQIWSAVTEKVADEMFGNIKNAGKEGTMNPIYTWPTPALVVPNSRSAGSPACAASWPLRFALHLVIPTAA